MGYYSGRPKIKPALDTLVKYINIIKSTKDNDGNSRLDEEARQELLTLYYRAKQNDQRALHLMVNMLNNNRYRFGIEFRLTQRHDRELGYINHVETNWIN